MSSGPPKGLLDGLTSIDERLTLVNEELNRIRNTISNIGGIDDGNETVGEVFQKEMSTDVPADTQTENPVETSRTAKQDIRLLEYVVGWPDGADNRVGVKLVTDQERVLFPKNPEDDFVAANNFTHPFTLRTEVASGTGLITQFVNLDTNNSHFINAVLTYEEL